MAINFNQGTQISAPNSSIINIPGRIVQFVDYQATVNVSMTTAAWVNTMSNAITVKAGNKVMVEYFCNDRSDQGNGTWSLIYHRVLCNGTQIMYSGYNGALANHIGFYERTFLYNPATAGTYTFQASVLAHQGTAYAGTAGTGATNQYLRLYEIGA
jgi:hypothetical protein